MGVERRTESIGVLSTAWKGGMADEGRKSKRKELSAKG